MAGGGQKSAGQCVVVTTRDGPLGLHIETLLDALKKQRGDHGRLSMDFAYLEDIFNDQYTPEDEQRYAQLIHHLVHAQLAIIDLSFSSASFYVLGIRQTLSNSPTIMLAGDDGIPTLANARFTEPTRNYINVSKDGWLDAALEQTACINTLQLAAYQNDLRASGAFNVTALENPFGGSRLHPRQWQLNASGNPKQKTTGPRIVIWEHQIQKAKGFDVWVNSENTFMEMARFWDKSVSAQIRKLGSVRRGPLKEDRYKDALGLALAEQMGTRSTVDVGTVFITPTDPASMLNCETGGGNGVKYVAHAAAVVPNRNGPGFSSGGEIDTCIRTVFREMHKIRRRDKGAQLNSVLFPLIGSGDGGAHPSFVAHQMVASLQRIIATNAKHPSKDLGLGAIKQIGLIAYQPSHLEFIARELKNYDFVEVDSGSEDDA